MLYAMSNRQAMHQPGWQGVSPVSSQGRHVEIPGPPETAPSPLTPTQVVGRETDSERTSCCVRPLAGPAQVHAELPCRRQAPPDQELKLKADSASWWSSAAAFRVPLQVCIRSPSSLSQPGLNWSIHARSEMVRDRGLPARPAGEFELSKLIFHTPVCRLPTATSPLRSLDPGQAVNPANLSA